MQEMQETQKKMMADLQKKQKGPRTHISKALKKKFKRIDRLDGLIIALANEAMVSEERKALLPPPPPLEPAITVNESDFSRGFREGITNTVKLGIIPDERMAYIQNAVQKAVREREFVVSATPFLEDGSLKLKSSKPGRKRHKRPCPYSPSYLK